MAVSDGLLLEMYRKMRLIRQFESRLPALFRQGLATGSLHQYIGEEAVAVGVCSALRPQDYITSTHRGHGHYLAKGGDAKELMAELLGRRTGRCKGLGGSLHACDFSVGFIGCSGVVGGYVPAAVGAGLSIQLLGEDKVSVCFFGDGASNQGVFHEASNLAATWKLPVVLVCENNLYAETTAINTVSSVCDIADRAVAYGFPGECIDGNDILAVYEATSKAVQRAREGSGPTLIECKTYRSVGHWTEDTQWYRSKEEIARWLEQDPLARCRSLLIDRGVLDDDRDSLIGQQIESLLDEAEAFAKASPEPTMDDVLANVYSQRAR